MSDLDLAALHRVADDARGDPNDLTFGHDDYGDLAMGKGVVLTLLDRLEDAEARLVVDDAMVERAAEAMWREQWARAVSEGRREGMIAWGSASRRARAEILLDARSALTAALGGDGK